MKSSGRRTGAALIVSCVLLSCAATDKRFGQDEWYQKTRQTSDKVVNMTKSVASASYKRMQKYLEEKEVLKTFHDTGEHSEAAVLDVLHRAGIGKDAQHGQAGKLRSGPNTTKQHGAGKSLGAPSTAGAPGNPAQGNPKMPKPPVTPEESPVPYTGDYRWPLDAGIISSEYGDRWGHQHKGIDIAADTGEPVYAVAQGEVIYAGDGLRGYGNVVILKHDPRITSLYAHNSELRVKAGQQVKQGDLIALLGSTGHSTGPHVHFEFREGDVAVNPHVLLPNSQIADAVPRHAAIAASN